MRFFVPVAVLASAANAYFLTGSTLMNSERVDPIVNPGGVAGHVHALFGGSNLRISTSTASLRQSFCTSVGIKEDKSAYWFPQLYFQWANGSFTSVGGGGVFYYLYSDTPGKTTPFPDDFRMISGTPTLRSYDPNSFAQQAVSFLCLDFDHGTPPPFTGLPNTPCPNGIRAQINFPSCWDGINVDSPDHKSHVAFLSGGPDKGTCSDPKFPKTLPRIFAEFYIATQDFKGVRDQAKNPNQPFVFAQGDPTGYGYHGDFINGWDAGVLQNVVDKCNCDPFGGGQCCFDRGIFTKNQDTNCHITNGWDEQTIGTILSLPGNNPVQYGPNNAESKPNNILPAKIDPIYAYVGDKPPGTGTVVGTGSTGRVLANLPTNTSPPAVSSSPASVPPAQPTAPPKDSTPTPSPVPPVTVGLPSPPTQSGASPIPQPSSTPDDGDHGYCYSSKNNARMKKPRGFRKRHHRRMHNAAIDGSF